MRDQARRDGENMPGRAIIALEPDDFRARKIRLEAQDVVDLGAAPAIDRLIVVADATDVLAPLRQQPQPQILDRVGVLIFVDEHIFEPVLILFQDLGIFAKETQAFEQKVAEIGGVEDFQPLLIERIKRRAFAIGEGGRLARRHMRRIEAAIFPGVDLIGERARGPALVVDILGLQHLFQKADLIIRIENGEARFQPDKLGVAAQDFGRNRVKRAEPGHAFGDRPGQHGDALLHFPRGLVGEGHGEDFMSAGPALRDDVRDFGGQNPGFAGARSGQHEKRAVDRLDRLALLGVQPVKIAARARPCAGGDSSRRGASSVPSERTSVKELRLLSRLNGNFPRKSESRGVCALCAKLADAKAEPYPSPLAGEGGSTKSSRVRGAREGAITPRFLQPSNGARRYDRSHAQR